MMLATLISAAIWVYLLGFHGRFWQAGPVLRAAPADGDAPTRELPAVDIVVPARDEAEHVSRALRSLLRQDYAGTLRVILVDDGSRDGTGDIAREIRDARLTVLAGAPRPPGWSGKLWAVAQGLAETRAPFVLLADADIEHDPPHLSTLVEKAEEGDLDLVSEMVALSCETPAERALVPAFVFFFQLLYPFAWVNDKLRATAAAAGGTMLVRRRALDRIGGIEAVRAALIDDVALAGAIKRGGSIWLGHAAYARSLRSYADWREVWRMVARTAYVQLRRSPALLAGCIAGMVLTWLVPPLATVAGHGFVRVLGLLLWLAMAASFVPTLRRFRRSVLWAPLLPAIATFYLAATIGSAIDHWRGRGVVWKSRAYQSADA
jgi:hopene-associated glycosyltransferase HpnB